MLKKNYKKNICIKRIYVFIFWNCLLIIVIVLRLFYLQIYQSAKYKLLSDKNRLVIKRVLPIRGNIIDRRGKEIAYNVYSYAVILDLLSIPKDNLQHVIDILKKFYANDVVLQKLDNLPSIIKQSNRYIVLKENLDWNELTKYYIISNKYPYISIEKTIARRYSFPIQCSHFLGYTSSPNSNDIVWANNPSLSLPTAKVGKSGIERQYEKDLFGKVGIQELEVNSRRQVIRTVNEIDSIPGDTIQLTIDINLQNEIYNMLSEQRSASCIVIDVNTGDILAFVSYPGYDINIFSKKIPSKLLKEIYANKSNPLINKSLSGLYAPGSTFKIITGLAGLYYGIINENTRFTCTGYSELGKHKFHCWRKSGHGSLTLQQALEKSCDVFFYNIAKRINPDHIAKVANDFGLGFKTGIDLPNEKSGLIPNKAWKKDKRKQKWTAGDSYNMAIGQGYVLTTPLQLAKMTCMFANGLKPITPHICKNNSEIKSSNEKLNYKQRHIDIILDGMYDVVNSPSGTAKKCKLKQFEIAGKTGSSQVRRITAAQRASGKTTFDVYENKEHALFISYAPVDDPQYAVCVVVEHGGSGASVAAPIAKEVFLLLEKLKYIKY